MSGFEGLMHGFSIALDPHNLLWCFVGVTIGNLVGVLPGMGGSQRLTRAIGKAKAMDLILTGRTIDAAEAERSGLVSRVVPADDLMTEARAIATTISQMSRSAARMAKEAVNRAFESTLAEGLLYERRLFHSTFATADQSEGMAAFVEKRPPNFTHR